MQRKPSSPFQPPPFWRGDIVAFLLVSVGFVILDSVNVPRDVAGRWLVLVPAFGLIGGGLVTYIAFVRRSSGGKARRRAERGLCVKCGYDLRATPEAGGPLLERCPECGSDTKASKVAAR